MFMQFKQLYGSYGLVCLRTSLIEDYMLPVNMRSNKSDWIRGGGPGIDL